MPELCFQGVQRRGAHVSNRDQSDNPGPSDDGNGGENTLRPAVHDRVKRRMTDFAEALDSAMTNPTPEALDRLRDAADQLMRATGRVIIEIEQLRGRR
jgi:hypothetical protein